MKETKLPCDTCIVDIVCDEVCDKLLDRDKIITTNKRIFDRLILYSWECDVIDFKNKKLYSLKIGRF